METMAQRQNVGIVKYFLTDEIGFIENIILGLQNSRTHNFCFMKNVCVFTRNKIWTVIQNNFQRTEGSSYFYGRLTISKCMKTESSVIDPF